MLGLNKKQFRIMRERERERSPRVYRLGLIKTQFSIMRHRDISLLVYMLGLIRHSLV